MIFIVLSKSDQLNYSSFLRGDVLNQSREIELTAKIYKTSKELEKAEKSILQVAKLFSQAENLVSKKNWVELPESGFLVVSGRI